MAFARRTDIAIALQLLTLQSLKHTEKLENSTMIIHRPLTYIHEILLFGVMQVFFSAVFAYVVFAEIWVNVIVFISLLGVEYDF